MARRVYIYNALEFSVGITTGYEESGNGIETPKE